MMVLLLVGGDPAESNRTRQKGTRGRHWEQAFSKGCQRGAVYGMKELLGL